MVKFAIFFLRKHPNIIFVVEILPQNLSRSTTIKKDGRRGKRQHEEERVFARRARIEEQFENGFSLQVSKNERAHSFSFSFSIVVRARRQIANWKKNESSHVGSLSLSLSLNARAKNTQRRASLPLLFSLSYAGSAFFSRAFDFFSHIETRCARYRARVKEEIFMTLYHVMRVV